jgi:hypothetical protein
MTIFWVGRRQGLHQEGVSLGRARRLKRFLDGVWGVLARAFSQPLPDLVPGALPQASRTRTFGPQRATRGSPCLIPDEDTDCALMRLTPGMTALARGTRELA